MKIKTACALICAALLLTSCGNGAGVTTAAESAREDTKTTADVTEAPAEELTETPEPAEEEPSGEFLDVDENDEE